MRPAGYGYTGSIEAILGLPPEPQSVRQARSFVRSSLAEWGEEWATEVTVLLTSEVVTNAVIHTGPHGPGEELVVALCTWGGVVHVEVGDRASALPVVRGPDDGLSGRGLLLLDALASAWGATERDEGKVVWFEVTA